MGTEMGFSNVREGGWKSWLPSALHPEAGLEEDTGEERPAAPDGDADAGFLFRSAIPVAGCLHVFDSATEHAAEAMPFWETFK
eukprot:5876325-Alexandrium_andersonii.AAC.1